MSKLVHRIVATIHEIFWYVSKLYNSNVVFYCSYVLVLHDRDCFMPYVIDFWMTT